MDVAHNINFAVSSRNNICIYIHVYVFIYIYIYSYIVTIDPFTLHHKV